MATLTTNLFLTKPAFNEYFDSWDDVVNANMDLIDTAVGALNTLTLGSAGGFGTIALRFTDVETNIAAVTAVADIDDGYTEGVPAAAALTYLGPNDAGSGQGAAGKLFHSIGLQLQELTGLADRLDLDAGVAARILRGPQGILNAGGATDLFSTAVPDTNLQVDPNGDFEVLVGGVYGIIRGTLTGGGAVRVLSSPLPAPNALHYLVATDVVWNIVVGATTGATSGSTFADATAPWGALAARPGDLVEITAGGAAVHGLYVIDTFGAGTLTINGAFPSNLGGLTYRFHLRRWVSLTLPLAGVGAGDVGLVSNGQAYDAVTGGLMGTVLASATMTAGSAFVAASFLQHAEGLHFDSGWQAAAGFWDAAASLDAVDGAGSVETYTVPLPDIPVSYKLFWSSAGDAGANAIPVPREDNAQTFGIRQFWNRNVLSVLAGKSADVLQDSAGAAVTLVNTNLGFFRLIAKG